MNKKNRAKNPKRYERVAFVLQGGGALGAFQVGAFRALHERGYRPNFLGGVSIGAINTGIIAGNPPEKQIEKLMEFWEMVATGSWFDLIAHDSESNLMESARSHFSAMQTILFGIPGFFTPRPFVTAYTQGTPDELSYYDISPLKKTLERLIDFDRINANAKEINYLVGAADIMTGEMKVFRNYEITIEPEHIMASCALPPSFPAIKIGDNYYWDGGIYANTPLIAVVFATPEVDTLCFAIDCFSIKGYLPANFDQIEERQKDIRFASRLFLLTKLYSSIEQLKTALAIIRDKLSPEIKQDPEISSLLSLGNKREFDVVHIICDDYDFTNSFKDYNFSPQIIKSRMESGYKHAILAMDKNNL